ncbi:hypothetical protein HDU98_004177 [Podochytrium sp. JEL0797]|nr:hypothetical protein HDU98_004177 [Podochytrium sp. JEL0797]
MSAAALGIAYVPIEIHDNPINVSFNLWPALDLWAPFRNAAPPTNAGRLDQQVVAFYRQGNYMKKGSGPYSLLGFYTGEEERFRIHAVGKFIVIESVRHNQCLTCVPHEYKRSHGYTQWSDFQRCNLSALGTEHHWEIISCGGASVGLRNRYNSLFLSFYPREKGQMSMMTHFYDAEKFEIRVLG